MAAPARLQFEKAGLKGSGRMLGFLAYLVIVTAAVHFSIEVLMNNAPIVKDLQRGIYGGLATEVLILGSSRANLHVDPRILARDLNTSVYNIGRPGGRSDLQLALWKIYLRHNRAPALLILSLDPDLALEREIVLPIQYSAIGHEPEFAALFKQTRQSYWEWRHLPLYRYTIDPSQWVLLLSYTDGARSVDGFIGYDGQWQNTYPAWKATHAKPWHLALEPNAAACLEEIARTANERGVQVVFVLSPVYHDYIDNAANFQDILRQYEIIAKRHSAVMLNYSSSKISQSKENFFDHLHLNRTGATRFSRQLGIRLEELVRQGRIRLDK